MKIRLSREVNAEGVSFLALSGSESTTAVVSDSGYGDGGYPAYWVFDSNNILTALVVDYLVAAEFLKRSVRVPWKPGISGVIHHDSELTVFVDQSEGVKIVCDQVDDVRWLNPAGKVCASGHQFGYSSSGFERCYHADDAKIDAIASEFEIVINTGFRNNR